jgi:hypothetical protein
MKWCELFMFGESEDPRAETVVPCRVKGPRRIIKYPNITGTHVHTFEQGIERKY